MKEIVRKVLASFIIVLMLCNSSMLTLVALAADSIEKNNVSMNVYFIDENGNKTNKLETSMSNQNLKLWLDIKVSEQGYFNGEIQLNNNNFKLNTEVSNENINSITENSIVLNQINAGDEVIIELVIQPIRDDMYDLNMLNRETNVIMSGTYVTGKNKNIKIDVGQVLNLSLLSPYTSSDIDKMNLQAQIVTNNIYNLNDENKRLVQLEIVSGLQNNEFPIKNTKLTLDVLDGVEDIKISKRGTYATNVNSEIMQNWDKNNKKLEINLSNAENDGKVQWNKSQNDTIIVTYVIDNDMDVEGNTINIKNDIELYDEADTIISKQDVISDMASKDGVINYSIINQNDMYKGNLYYGEDTNYSENTVIDIRYPQISKNISINQGNATYVADNKEINADSKYIETTVNKEDIINVLGDTGVLNIKDINGNILTTLTKQNLEEKEENINLNYNEQNNIIVEIENAQNEGIINLTHSKKLNKGTYSKEQMKKCMILKTSGVLQADNNVENKTSETTINLLEPVSYATITSNVSELSTLQSNQNVQFNVILKTDDLKYDLYKNPSVELILPNEISNVQAQMNPVFIDGFSIKETTMYKNADGNNILKVTLDGEQQNHSNNVSEGIIININANIDIDKNVSTRDSEIVLHYTNQNDGTDVHEQKIPIRIKSKDGLLFYDRVENYNANGDILESMSNETLQGNLDMSTDARNLTNKMLFVNNYDVPVTNVTIIESNDNSANVTLPVSNISGVQSKIYYSENGTDWVEDASTLDEIKDYKINIDSIQPGDYVDVASDFNIQENLDYNQKAILNKQMTYFVGDQEIKQEKQTELNTKEQNKEYTEEKNENTEQIVDTYESAKPSLETIIETSVGTKKLTSDDIIHEGEIIKNTITLKNTSTVDAKNVKVAVKQHNAVIYDIVEVKVINPSITGSETEEIIEHNYGDWTTGEKTFDTIPTIKAGETKVISYQARINKITGDVQNTYGTVTVEADEVEKITKDTIKNNIAQGKIQMTMKNSYNEELEKYDGESVNTSFYIKNTSNEVQKNVKVDVQLSKNYYIYNKDADIKFYYNDGNWEELGNDKITGVDYNSTTNIITFNIAELSAKDDLIIVMEPIAKNTDTSSEFETAEVSAKALVGKDEYYSNIIQKDIYSVNRDITVDYSIKDAKEKYSNGDEINFVITVSNNGFTTTNVGLTNDMSGEFNVSKILKVNNGLSTDITKELEDNSLIILDEDLEAGKVLQIEITARVNFDEENDEVVTNQLSVSTDGIESSIDKELEITLKGSSSNSNDNNKDDDNKGDNNNNKNNISISGVLWNDKDKNGKREDTEKGIGDVEVRLVEESGNFVKDDNGNIVSCKTNSLGEYQFNVKKGRYIVLFLYDNQNYDVTEYKKDGIDESLNSDVISKEVNIDGSNRVVAITDIIDATMRSVINIDAGLYERQKFDLKLDKFITKVSVQNSQGTKQNEFGREQLAKVEIKAKQFIGSTIAVEYQIQVTNEGEIDGFVNDVIDYIPEGFKFSSELNKDWYVGTDKNLHNTSLENEKIKVGETKILDLVLTKTLTQSNGQTLINTAEIYKASNSENINDKDSTPGNKKNGEDDMSSATLIVAISTGIGKIFIGSILIVLFVILVIAIVMKKKGGIIVEEDEK